MNFFEPPPPIEPPDIGVPQRQAWWGAPGNELGVAVPLRILLARTSDVAVAVVEADAYSTGIALRLVVKWREAPVEPRAHDLLGRMPQGTVGGELPPEVLRFGVQFADGRKATSVGRSFLGSEDKPAGPVLAPGGGSGSDREWETSFWLWPLPPAGPLALVIEWPAEGIAETRHEVDAQPFLDAAGASEMLWPEDPDGDGGSWTGYAPMAPDPR